MIRSTIQRATGAILVALALVSHPLAQNEPVDYLSLPGPFVFEGTTFALSWSSQASADYIKQEYLPAGEDVANYGEMLLIEVITSPLTVADAVASQTEMLESRRGSDPVVNYEVIQNDATGEMILDFLLSDDSTGTMVVEWNAYRYVPFGDGVALYAISRRGYGQEGSLAFIETLSQWRLASIEALATMDLTEIENMQ